MVLLVSHHLERPLQIDSLLSSGIRQTQKSLAEATEVTDRTIRSDLDFLRDRYNAPLEYQKDLRLRVRTRNES